MQKPDWFDSIGDWNPQLLRELKGRLKPRNLILAGAISILGQFLLWVSFLLRIPHPTTDLTVYKGGFPSSHLYCTGSIVYRSDRTCLVDATGNLLVDWQRWSLDLFLALSIIGIFALLVAGTYLLIDNLAYEERKGTLNFIRLSPRSPQNILWGKILGVPILLYIVALLAFPLHLGSGIAAHIPLFRILSFYGVLGMSCVFFYSFSLLLSLISFGVLGRLQALLGSGIVFLVILAGISKPVTGDPLDWIDVFSPALVLQDLIVVTGIKPTTSFSDLGIEKLQWFNLPVGMGIVGVVSILILNYSLWTYWSWQALQRRFASPTKTIFSKRQSYLLVACFEIVVLGFAVHGEPSGLIHHFYILLACNFLVFFGLIIALTPQRQALIDWARYRKQKPSIRKGLLNLSLLRDLVWGEKSPAIVAIALNAAITTIILVPWIILGMDNRDKLSALMTLVLSLSLIMVCAAISQLVALTQTKQQELWIIGVLLTVIIFAPLVIGLLSINSVQTPTLLLFTIFAFAAVEKAGAFSIFLTLLGQLSLLTLCSVQISRQLKKAGASNSIGLFAPPKALLP
ncbi:hypothetical protein [Synechocystis sp. PCC 7509]|uniref:hypothetical protein n=1 Tax=Synechocystis sp. PCC 7509 TaxID=927677 RepID=UPI0002ABA031|nr:hypothetical protein [Synechocystis sp. PCC 7509]